MHLNNVPGYIKDKRIEVERVMRRYAAAATEAEREAERLRALANDSHAPVQEHRRALAEHPAALKHAKDVRALAAAESLVFDAIEKMLQEAGDSTKFEHLEVNTAGHGVATVNAKLTELDKQIHAIQTAYVPRSREQIELEVSALGRAFERGVKFQSGGKMIFPTDFFNEQQPDWWRYECSVRPAAAVEWLLRVEQERASHPYPPAERPAALARLREEKLALQYVAAKLIDEVRDGDRGPQTMRDPNMPVECVLGIRIKLPAKAQAAA